MSGTAGNIGTNARVVLDHAGARLLYTGTGETTDRTLEIKSGGTLEHAGSGPLVFTAPTTSSTTGTKKLTLRNFAAAEGECRGAIVNGSGIVSLAKEGNGTWSLTAANTFSGTLAVHEGTLILSGAAGAAASAASYSVSNGATLRLDNTAIANHANRLNDAGSVTLLGGTLRFANDAGAANFSESAGALVAGYGACTVQTDQSADGRTSALRFASLSRLNGATLAFVGAGLGMSDRNRVFITGQPEGPLGNWITLNGQPAYYSAANGVTEMPAWSVTEIAARGPSSVVPNNAAAAVHITQSGTDGPIL
jgi:autotransporter-associated beta strand protein